VSKLIWNDANNQNHIYKTIINTLNLRNACHSSVQSILRSTY